MPDIEENISRIKSFFLKFNLSRVKELKPLIFEMFYLNNDELPLQHRGAGTWSPNFYSVIFEMRQGWRPTSEKKHKTELFFSSLEHDSLIKMHLNNSLPDPLFRKALPFYENGKNEEYAKAKGERICFEYYPLRLLLRMQDNLKDTKEFLIRSKSEGSASSLNFMSNKPSKAELTERLSSLKASIISKEKLLLAYQPKLLLLHDLVDFNQRHWEKYSELEKEKRNLRGLETSARKAQKESLIKEKAAAFEGKTRTRTRTAKTKVEKNSKCPYCGAALTSQSHLDHIYPVSKGGLNIESNLVFCCESCNLKKSNKSLRRFCEESKIDYYAATDRLHAMGKDV